MKFELEPYNRGMPDSALLDDLRRVACKLGKDYVTKTEYNQHGSLRAQTLQKRFGSWRKAHELAGFEVPACNCASVEDCLVDLRRVAQAIGKTTLTIVDYERHGKFSKDVIRGRFGSWRLAVECAGLAPTPAALGRRSDEELFENLEHLWETLGRQPRHADFVKPLSSYSYDVYPRRFGSFRKALEAFVASFESRGSERSDESASRDIVDGLPVTAQRRHRTTRTISWRMRFLVLRRDDFKCRSCGTSPAIRPGTVLVVDHIVPWAKGGETVMENLQTLCEPCNGGKSDLPMDAD